MRRFPELSHELLGPRARNRNARSAGDAGSHNAGDAGGAWSNALRIDLVNYLVDHCVQGITYISMLLLSDIYFIVITIIIFNGIQN